MSAIAAILILVTMAGLLGTVLQYRAIDRFAQRPAPPPVAAEPVTLLKPLHGAEPRLTENLQSFLDQQWDAPIEMVAGVAEADDPALADLARLEARGQTSVTRVVDPRRRGANAKVDNLANMMAAATHSLLVVSDSDMAAPPGYLQAVAAALTAPGVGAATCVFRGRGDAGGWSVFAAAMLSYTFLPAVLLGLMLKFGHPCMGATIALRRETLDRIGGFVRFADRLADDHAIGMAVRERGLRVAVAGVVLTHGSIESGPAAVWRHELRWAATLRTLAGRPAYLGMMLTSPVPAALALCAAWPAAGGPLLAATVLARVAVARRVDRLCGARTASPALLPLRDLATFAVQTVAFFARSIDWRGARLRIAGDGRLAAEPETTR